MFASRRNPLTSTIRALVDDGTKAYNAANSKRPPSCSASILAGLSGIHIVKPGGLDLSVATGDTGLFGSCQWLANYLGEILILMSPANGVSGNERAQAVMSSFNIGQHRPLKLEGGNSIGEEKWVVLKAGQVLCVHTLLHHYSRFAVECQAHGYGSCCSILPPNISYTVHADSAQCAIFGWGCFWSRPLLTLSAQSAYMRKNHEVTDASPFVATIASMLMWAESHPMPVGEDEGSRRARKDISSLLGLWYVLIGFKADTTIVSNWPMWEGVVERLFRQLCETDQEAEEAQRRAEAILSAGAATALAMVIF